MRTQLSLTLLLIAACATGRLAPTQDRGDLAPNNLGYVRFGLGKVDFEVPGAKADSNAMLFGLGVDAGNGNLGGGVQLDVYLSEDDILGPAFTESYVLGAEAFPHFTYRPAVGDRFRIPLRIGPYVQLHSLDAETAANDATISYLSIGGQFEVEPEFDIMRKDNFAFGIHGRLRFGGAWATIDDDTTVSALWLQPSKPRATYVFAHGAGAGMQHSFMEALSQAWFEHSVATLRYQFPSMERGSKRPDSPALAHATVRAAVAAARERLPDVPLLAGGKSFGGRMTSQAQAAAATAGVRGLVFVGFPLHPAGKPGIARAAHLADVDVPMLFLQGTRDDLADLALLRGVVQGLGDKATLHLEDDAEHAFHVRVRSGRNDAQVVQALAQAVAAWLPRISR